MQIERTADEIIIRLPSNIDIDELERILDYLSYTEATTTSKAKQEEIDELAKTVKKGWWKENKEKLTK